MLNQKVKNQILTAWTIFSWGILVAATLGWALSAFHVIAKNEPQTVLHLSWAAIWIGAMGNLMTVYVFHKVSENGN